MTSKTFLDGLLHLRHRFDNAADSHRYLLDEGFTHLLLYNRGMPHIIQTEFDPVTPDDSLVLQELQTAHWSTVAEWIGAYVLYKVHP